MRYIERIPMDLDETEIEEHNWNFKGESLHHKIDNMKNIFKSFKSPFQMLRGIINRIKGYSDISSNISENDTEMYSNFSDQPERPKKSQWDNETADSNDMRDSNFDG